MYKKILSIIIPYYNETPNCIFPLLSSIHNQVGINFEQIECILINDGNQNKFSSDFLSMFTNLNIRCIYMKENKGPGIARQTGIDHATGEYVMFCDADDILHSVAVLGAFLQEINTYHPDIITSSWLEEMYDSQTDKHIYIPHENEITWMHGKLFRRLFLQSKNIRFHDNLRLHEDSYFLAIATALTESKRKCLFTSYVWKFNPTSITRRDNASYTYDSTQEFFKSIKYAFEVIQKAAPYEMQYKVVQFIMYNYFVFHQPHWLAPENSDRLITGENFFAKMMEPYMQYFHEATADFLGDVYNQEREKLFKGFVEVETLDEWLNRVIAKKQRLYNSL